MSFGCAYCRGRHETDAELQACADWFWARNDASKAFERSGEPPAMDIYDEPFADTDIFRFFP